MNSSKMVLMLLAVGLGFGYAMERDAQDAPRVAFTPQRESAWLQHLDPGYQKLLRVMQ
jgi:hypothetical protein